MASHSEIALVESTKKTAKPKAKAGKTRRAAQSKTAKRSTARTRAQKPSGKQTPGTAVVPVMKLRAIDIVDHEKPNGSGTGKTVAAKDEVPQVIPMPPSPQTGSAIAADKSMVSGAGAHPETENPAGTDGAPLVTDPELLELLEQLSTTIDTANTVLDAASTLPAEEGAPASAVSDPKPEPTPQPEPESDEPPPLAAQSDSLSPPRPARARAAFIGFGAVVNAALTALVLIAGGAWLLFTNPWILEYTPGAPVQQEQTVRAPLAKVQSAPVLPVRKPGGTTTMRSPAQTSVIPPNGNPLSVKTVVPPAPKPATTVRQQIGGAAGQPIALGISLPAIADQTEISVMVQGVPEKAKLSAGKGLGAGSWLLNETQLQGVTLNTTEDLAPGAYELEVIFVRSDGKVPETRKLLLSVQPAAVAAAAAAPKQLRDKAKPGTVDMQTTFVKTGVALEAPTATPEQAAPAPAPAKQLRVTVKPNKPALTPQEANTILIRGDTLLGEGDVAGARLLFEYAAERGSKKAMVKLGESYDGKYLRELGGHGIQPDDTQAAHWYSRASGVE